MSYTLGKLEEQSAHCAQYKVEDKELRARVLAMVETFKRNWPEEEKWIKIFDEKMEKHTRAADVCILGTISFIKIGEDYENVS